MPAHDGALMAPGQDLRDARAHLGMSVDEAAHRTRIPLRYLLALESGDLSVFPAGPFASGYTRQYRKFLGLPEVALRPAAVAPPPAREEPPERTEHTGATVTSPLIPSRPRLVALAVGVAGTLALAALVARSAMDTGEPEVGQVPDQVVFLTANEPLRARITADGRTAFSGTLSPGQQRKFEAHDRLELDLPSLDGVTVVYNGRTLKPLGAQSRARRLVFIDDRGAP